MKFETTDAGNEVLSGDGFYISYREEVLLNPADELLVEMGVAKSRTGKDETALYVEDHSKFGGSWYILNGDFRKMYLEAFPDKEKCLAVYNEYKDMFRSDFSTD